MGLVVVLLWEPAEKLNVGLVARIFSSILGPVGQGTEARESVAVRENIRGLKFALLQFNHIHVSIAYY